EGDDLGSDISRLEHARDQTRVAHAVAGDTVAALQSCLSRRRTVGVSRERHIGARERREIGLEIGHEVGRARRAEARRQAFAGGVPLAGAGSMKQTVEPAATVFVPCEDGPLALPIWPSAATATQFMRAPESVAK